MLKETRAGEPETHVDVTAHLTIATQIAVIGLFMLAVLARSMSPGALRCR